MLAFIKRSGHTQKATEHSKYHSFFYPFTKKEKKKGNAQSKL